MAHANKSVRNEVRKGEDFGETGLEVRAVGRGPRVQKVASRHGHRRGSHSSRST